jgi:hypothetical protein
MPEAARVPKRFANQFISPPTCSNRRNDMKLVLILTFASLAVIVDQALADQPKMETALSSLKQARESLKGASADKGGYRAQAIRSIDQAIEQVKAGIEFDRANQSKNERQKEPKGWY